MAQSILPENITIKALVAMIMADIEIGLLKEADQETDINKVFTNEEIREQLDKTGKRIISALKVSHIDVDENIKTKIHLQ